MPLLNFKASRILSRGKYPATKLKYKQELVREGGGLSQKALYESQLRSYMISFLASTMLVVFKER